MNGSVLSESESQAPKRTFLRRRILDPLAALLKQGATPEGLALSLAVGITIGTFPIVGTTTVLCLLLALVLRLNIAAIQLVNWFVYPAQLALLIPFVRIGERLFGARSVPLSISEIEARFREGFAQALSTYGHELLSAIAAWAMVAPLLAALLFFALRPALRRMAVAIRERRAARAAAG